MFQYVAKAWCRWLQAAGLPAAHIAIVIDLDALEVDSYLTTPNSGTPAFPCHTYAPRGRVDFRRVTDSTAIKIARLKELGYDTQQIARALSLGHVMVLNCLERLTPVRKTRLVRPRTAAQHTALKRKRARQEKARRSVTPLPAPPEIPADELWRYLDGAAPYDRSMATITPAAVELEDLVVIKGAPPASSTWDGPATIQLGPYGEEHGRAKLTWALVREIRRQHAVGWSMYRLAKDCGVTAGTIRAVVRNQTWIETAPLPSPSEADCPENVHSPGETGQS